MDKRSPKSGDSGRHKGSFGEGDESTRRGDPQALPSIESVHCRSPSKHRLKTILSLEESLAQLSKKRCGFCHNAEPHHQIEALLGTRRDLPPLGTQGSPREVFWRTVSELSKITANLCIGIVTLV
jgi:hypothetical protein